MHPIIRLVNRNITISVNPGFLIWQVIFPLIWIFVAGFAYTSLIDEVSFGTKNLSYPAFLASGMIGFNIMNSTLISGIIIWNDRRHGMFEQIMSGPFTRSNYIQYYHYCNSRSSQCGVNCGSWLSSIFSISRI